jgi:hypothetical protein
MHCFSKSKTHHEILYCRFFSETVEGSQEQHVVSIPLGEFGRQEQTG